jgi:hypothetical protein
MDVKRIVIEVDSRRYEALLAEAARLQIEVEELIDRAAAAWMVEINEYRGTLPHAILQPELVAAG